MDVADLPEPGLTLLDLDAALNVPDVLPPGTEIARLDPGSYKLRLPGGDAWVRVTTDAEVFDEHAESHGFLSPGGTFFESLAIPRSEESLVPREGLGHCWLVEQGGAGGTCEMFVATPEGPTPVRSPADLPDRLNRPSTAGMFDFTEQLPAASVLCRCQVGRDPTPWNRPRSPGRPVARSAGPEANMVRRPARGLAGSEAG
jgi:hypothetical protein